MAKKAYVVIERGYEYNDEIYHQPETDDDCGKPEHVYFDQKKALDVAQKLNSKFFSGLRLCEYCYGIDEILVDEDEETCQKLSEIIGKPLTKDELEEFEVPENLTEKQLEEISKLFNLEFYSVVAVDAD